MSEWDLSEPGVKMTPEEWREADKKFAECEQGEGFCIHRPQPPATDDHESESYLAQLNKATGEEIAAPRGEQWTLALAMVPDRDTRKALEIAHDCLLVVDRKKRASDFDVIVAKVVQLEQQLAAEREKLRARDLLIKQLEQDVEAKERRCNETYQQLLQAQAALRAANRYVGLCIGVGTVEESKAALELSRSIDALVKKP